MITGFTYYILKVECFQNTTKCVLINLSNYHTKIPCANDNVLLTFNLEFDLKLRPTNYICHCPAL